MKTGFKKLLYYIGHQPNQRSTKEVLIKKHGLQYSTKNKCSMKTGLLLYIHWH